MKVHPVFNVSWTVAKSGVSVNVGATQGKIRMEAADREMTGAIMQAVAALPDLLGALDEALSWTVIDKQSIEDITPDANMLVARIKVLKSALSKAGVTP